MSWLRRWRRILCELPLREVYFLWGQWRARAACIDCGRRVRYKVAEGSMFSVDDAGNVTCWCKSCANVEQFRWANE